MGGAQYLYTATGTNDSRKAAGTAQNRAGWRYKMPSPTMGIHRPSAEMNLQCGRKILDTMTQILDTKNECFNIVIYDK